ncbi:uncharacterized protein LOC128726946 [Anopheles nili]|uniref:uncharacterized protein LOC128726946 n=1 Tax=Anopheles nili TaxID=185578 RepID=UPI00237BB093|nr:uncharacterized protein LOC128726946 [Anopheles nili]
MAASTKIRICPSRYEFNDPLTEKDERCRMLDDFERNMAHALRRIPLQRKMDHTLPRRLGERTKCCIDAVPVRTKPPIEPITWRKQTSSRENRSLLERPQALEVTIDPRTKPRALPPRVENWMENFLRKPTRQRVRWRSKLHDTEARPQVPAERMEQLIDVGTQDFVDWLNALGAERSSLTTGVVKGLFSIQTADETSRALILAPKEVRAVPNQVAAEWQLPQLALENRIAQLHDRDRKLAAGGVKRTAFGRGLPRELRRGWIPDDCEMAAADVERPDVPDDLMSLKRLFRDIWHLRSVKYLVDYLTERPALPKPRFLIEKGLFQRQDAIESVPFYRKVLSQQAIAESIKK